MKNAKFFFITKFLSVATFLVFIGCTTTSPASTPPVQAVSVVSTIVVSRVLRTQIPPNTVLVPSATPNKTPTATSTVTIQPTPISTLTLPLITIETPFAIPTPPGSDVVEQVFWLLETNNGCQLPCWWGITPGQTEWEVAENLLTLFDPQIYTTSASGIDYYNPTIPLPFGIYQVNQVSPIYTVQNDIVQKIETQVSIGDTPSGYLTQYALPAFLTTYGPPGEVWLNTYSSAFEENDLPFFVILFYPIQGIVAVYDDNGEVKGNMVEGCLHEKPVSRLVLLPPSLHNTFEETISKTSGLGERDYLLLGEATEIDVTAFYETFKNPDNTTCLETRADLWD